MLKKVFLPSFMFIVIGLLIVPLGIHAAEDGVNFSVQSLIPENQIDKNQSYFDLKMEPGQNQQLKVNIHNNGAKEITVLLSVHNASTNSNGLVVYEKIEEIDPSLTVPLTEILSFPDEKVTIPGGQSHVVVADLQMPKEEFDGMILGGFHFEKVMEEKEPSEGVSIQNKHAYVIGVKLTENDNEVSPHLHFNSVRPDLVNYRTAVIANIQNSEALIINDLTMHARIYKAGKKEIYKEELQEQINMAPNSNMDFIVGWDNKRIEPGTYRLEMEAFHNEEKWSWEEEFVIESEVADDMNEDAVELDEDEQGSIWIFIGIMILVLIIIILLLYIRKLKRLAIDINKREDL